MALSLQLGFPNVPKSITNPDVLDQDALDLNNPLPFLSFIKIINVSFEPDSLQKYYNYYVKTWNNKNNKKDSDDENVILQRYVDFLKDISLNYTTKEEKEFLGKVDFSDPYDLDIIIGFYGKKLKEISLYYNSKRNDVKFNLVRNKLKGTNFGIEKTLIELTLAYLKNLDDGKMLYDYEKIKSNLEIEIEELYDIYPLYFNQDPNPKIYDNKDLDYGYNLFLTDDKTTISRYLSSVSPELQQLKEFDDLFENKRRLTEKYMSTDFYYLSTGNTTSNFLSGKLFEAVNPSSNFLNRNYPTTASTERLDYLQTPREKGFFKPSNTSIVLIDGLNSSYSINLSNLSPNSLYFYPDPTIIGSTGEVLTFTVDDSYLKKNFSSGEASNQPSTSQYDTKYYGYVSKIEPNFQKYLDIVFDEGFVQDSKRDIYNNLFGLFKNDHRFHKTIEVEEGTTINNIIFNGYKFYDDMYDEGYNFNFFTPNLTAYGETIKTGLSTYTGDFNSPNPQLTLYFGSFTPYNELTEPSDLSLVTQYEIIEGGYISKSDFSLYPDAISSDLSAFSSTNGDFYYTDLIEGALNSIGTRALSSNVSSLTANALTELNLSAYDIVEGGRFESPFDSVFKLNTYDYYYDDTVLNPSVYTLDTFNINDYPNYTLEGQLLIKNNSTRQVLPLLEVFPYMNTKYNSSIVSELSGNIVNFDISNDILVIETPSYLTIDRIVYENGQFKDPKNAPMYITHDSNDYDKVSNRYKKDNHIIYAKLKIDNDSLSSNNFIVYPEIYQFDTLNFKNLLIFPQHPSDITDYFNVSGGSIKYTKSDTPILTYNSRNNIFNISFLMKDQNNNADIHSYDYHLSPNVTFLKHQITKSEVNAYTNSLESLDTFNLFLSGGSFNFEEGELIL